MTEISFYMPCLNEELNVASSLNTIISLCKKSKVSNFEILVFNDGSKDNSKNIINSFINKNNMQDKIKLINNERTLGLGYNYIEGAYIASGKFYIMVCSDNSEDEHNLLKIISLRGKADMVIPNFVNNDNRNFLRRKLSRLFTIFVNLLSGNNIKYYNGIVLHKTYNVRRWHPLSCGFGYQAELITNLISVNKNYIEVEIENKDRNEGISRAFKTLNLLSITHTLIQIFFRRIRKLIWNV